MEYHRRGGEEESRRIQEKYRESLNDLTVNSKPIINALTFAAEDHVHDGHAIDVVTVLEDHILRVREMRRNKKVCVACFMHLSSGCT